MPKMPWTRGSFREDTELRPGAGHDLSRLRGLGSTRPKSPL